MQEVGVVSSLTCPWNVFHITVDLAFLISETELATTLECAQCCLTLDGRNLCIILEFRSHILIYHKYVFYFILLSCLYTMDCFCTG